MKRLMQILLAASVLPASAIMASDHPFQLAADYNHVSPSKVERPRKHRGAKMSFAEGRLLALYTHELTKDTGLKFSIGAMETRMHWQKYKPFRTKHFENVLIDVGGYAMNVEKWVLDADLSLQVNAKHASLSRYTYFRGIIHGRYDWKKDVGLHIGLVGGTGMRYTRILPVIGFDYKQSEKLRYNVIFPLNFSAIYSLTSDWSVEAAIRSFNSVQRMPKHDKFRRGIVVYNNYGAELGLDYKKNETIEANIHFGQAFGGSVRVGNHHDKHATRYHLHSGLYWGFAARWNF